MVERRGFVLLIVIGIIAVLASVAIVVRSRTATAAGLSLNHLARTRAFLAAQSGVERVEQETRAVLVTSFGTSFDPVEVTGILEAKGSIRYVATARDLSGGINVNDGITAGRLENTHAPIDGGYKADAIDPWPQMEVLADEVGGDGVTDAVGLSYSDLSVDFASIGIEEGDTISVPYGGGYLRRAAKILSVAGNTIQLVAPGLPPNLASKTARVVRNPTDVSAWINLRIRRLLNSYGDVHKFKAELGWPVHRKTDFDVDPGSYGEVFESTSTGPVIRYRQSAGPLDTGLGDRIVSGRPANGYHDIGQVEGVVRDWAKAHLPAGYLDEEDFWVRIRDDLCVSSHEDRSMARLTRELGPDRDGDGYADFNPLLSDPGSMTAPLATEPPDMTDLWRPHAAALININSASDEVRAAVFHAPVNVSYVAEGRLHDSFLFKSSAPYDMTNFSPTLGVRGPVFKSNLLLENGVATSSSEQLSHLVSMRDAMVMARAWRELGDLEGYPLTWAQMGKRLRDFHGTFDTPSGPDAYGWCPDPDRVNDPGIIKPNAYETKAVSGPAFVSQYIEVTLPRVLSPVRRLPSWMGAPWSQSAPFMRLAGMPVNGQLAQLSAEDFVFRMCHPKVCFTPKETYRVRASGVFSAGDLSARVDLECRIRLLGSLALRSQKDLLGVTNSSTSAQVRIGPEPPFSERLSDYGTGPGPSGYLGVVGLDDRQEILPGTVPPGVRKTALYFDGPDVLSAVEESASDLLPKGWILPSTGQPHVDGFSTINNAGVTDITPPGFLPVSASTPLGTLLLWQDEDQPGRGDDVTWSMPVPGEEALSSMFGGLFPPANAVAFVEAVIGVFPGFPGPGLTANEYAQWLLGTPMVPPGWEWPTRWRRGFPPAAAHPVDHSVLDDSRMEGSVESIFPRAGRETCDLSPFGGLRLGGFRHGARRANPFNDSLYFRPTDIAPPKTDSGAVFSRGTVSFWYRIPTGYPVLSLQESRVLFHLLLWERVEQQQGSDFYSAWPTEGPAQKTRVVNRPVSISAMHTMSGPAAYLYTGRTPHFGSTPPNIPYHDVLPEVAPSWIPLPTGSTYRDPVYDTLLMVPQDFEDSPPVFDIDNLYLKWFTDFEVAPTTLVYRASYGGPVSKYQNLPGQWKRFVVSWRGGMPTVPKDRLFGHEGGLGTPNLVSSTGVSANGGLATLNPAPILTFGEAFLVHDHEATLGIAGGGIKTAHLREDGTYDHLPDEVLSPFLQLNSLVDNIVMAFGDDIGFATDQAGFTQDLQTMSGGHQFFTMRYPLATPKIWQVDLPAPAGAELLAAGVEVDDVPHLFSTHDSDFEGFAFPSVSVHCPSGQGTALRRMTIRDSDGDEHVAESLHARGYPGTPVPGGEIAVHVTWEAMTPDGKVLDPTSYGEEIREIPWVNGIWATWLLPRPRVESRIIR